MLARPPVWEALAHGQVASSSDASALDVCSHQTCPAAFALFHNAKLYICLFTSYK